MNVQDDIASKQISSYEQARTRIDNVASLAVTAIISPSRHARLAGEEDQVVRLKATDPSGFELEVRQGKGAFNDAEKISVSELFNKRGETPENSHLRIPGSGSVAKKLSGALHLLNIKQDVQLDEALEISSQHPELKSYSRSGLSVIVDRFRVDIGEKKEPVREPLVATPKPKR
ncbi:hypothetical protein [Alteromonas sp. 14N.309.X.WAT.G.H12]|uniref:hypothetical protein n=1 Tax=Alteromonas sp. 14N.309.X.WAT.G.H12 TaxID=3120824 RepID=UPI002FD07A0F